MDCGHAAPRFWDPEPWPMSEVVLIVLFDTSEVGLNRNTKNMLGFHAVVTFCCGRPGVLVQWSPDFTAVFFFDAATCTIDIFSFWTFGFMKLKNDDFVHPFL